MDDGINILNNIVRINNINNKIKIREKEEEEEKYFYILLLSLKENNAIAIVKQ